eukprot:scaffold402347_cov38-Attheya_sp.AAC.1
MSAASAEHGKMLGKQIDCVTDSCSCPRFCNVHPMAPVVLHGWANIPPNFSMWCPAWAVMRFVM